MLKRPLCPVHVIASMCQITPGPRLVSLPSRGGSGLVCSSTEVLVASDPGCQGVCFSLFHAYVPNHPFHISLDFITDLPTSNHKTTILISVDCSCTRPTSVVLKPPLDSRCGSLWLTFLFILEVSPTLWGRFQGNQSRVHLQLPRPLAALLTCHVSQVNLGVISQPDPGIQLWTSAL